MTPLEMKSDGSKRELIRFVYAMAQVFLCLVGAYLIASGFSFFGIQDETLNSLLSKGAQRSAGLIAFSIGTVLWYFEDYIF